MHAIRSLVALAAMAAPSFAEAPKTIPAAAVTVRVVSIHESESPAFARLIANGTPDLAAVLKAVESYRTANMLQMPKFTLTGGKTGEVTTGMQKKIITDVDAKVVNGNTVVEPRTETINDGTTVKVTSTVKEDRKSIELTVDARHTVINQNVPLFPVTTFIQPAGGKPGDPPVPFTQFYVKPDVQTAKYAGTATLTAGGSRIVDLGTLALPNERVVTPSVVAKVPYLNRLFASKKATVEKYQAYLILTADVVELPPATELVADYRTAVSEGRTADAKALAEKAIALDPLCFAK